MSNNLFAKILRIIAIFSIIIGAVYSLIFTLHAGHKNKSSLLPALFIIWVLSPYFALIFANVRLRYSVTAAQNILYTFTILISLGSLLGYSEIINLPDAKPAAIFLFTPLISWILIVLFIITTIKLRKLNK